AAIAHMPPEAVLFLVDGRGTLLAQHPAGTTPLGQPVRAPVVDTILRTRQEGATDAEGPDGVRRLYAFAPVQIRAQGTELYVAVGVPLRVAYAEADRSLVRNLAAVGIAGLLSIFAAWAAGDLFVVRRMKALVAATTGLAAGDLSIRTGLG